MRVGTVSNAAALLGVAVVGLCSSLPYARTASAQPPTTRAIVPIPYNDSAPVAVTLTAGSGELRIGSTVTICFEASRPGFVTVWNVATTGAAARVYPNAHQSAQSRDWTAMKVDGARRACVGTTSDPFRFRVDGPPGTEDLYLLWTARPDLQPGRPDFADSQALAAEITRKVDGAATHEWTAVKTTYDIVPSTGAAPPPLPPTNGPSTIAPPPAPPPQPQQQTQTPPPSPAPSPAPAPRRNRIFVLSLGANVGELVKPNQDATLFAKTITEMFDVPRTDVRLVANARKADFRAGLQWLRTSAAPHDMVFIYFSGHGGRVRDPTGTSDDGYDEFLVPYDFEGKRPQSLKDAVFSQELAGWINAIPTDNIIVVADACHSAGVYRSIEGGVLGARSKLFTLPPDADLTREEAPAAPATRAAGGAGRIKAKGLLLAAARRDQSALEASDGSIFTMALLREMRTARGGTLADTFARATELSRARSNNRQTPTAVGPIDVARLVEFAP